MRHKLLGSSQVIYCKQRVTSIQVTFSVYMYHSFQNNRNHVYSFIYLKLPSSRIPPSIVQSHVEIEIKYSTRSPFKIHLDVCARFCACARACACMHWFVRVCLCVCSKFVWKFSQERVCTCVPVDARVRVIACLREC